MMRCGSVYYYALLSRGLSSIRPAGRDFLIIKSAIIAIINECVGESDALVLHTALFSEIIKFPSYHCNFPFPVHARMIHIGYSNFNYILDC